MTLLLAVSSLISRILGMVRNHELAASFGASDISDAYFAAFQIPDTLYRLLVFGAISASFVPLFLSLHRKNADEAWEFASSVLNGFLIVVFLSSLMMFFFAEGLTGILYSDFSAVLQQETADLLRLMLLSPILFTLSSFLASVQNAFRSFWGFAMAPIVYNAGILFGIVFLAPSLGIRGVAYGVVLGAFLHAVVQLIPVIRLGFSWKPILVWSQAFRKLLLNAIPRILSIAGAQINFFIEGVIATMLTMGSLTILRYAQDIQSFPIGVFGISMAVSSFSVMSTYVLEEKLVDLGHYLREKIDHLLFLIIPAAFGLYILRFPLIDLLLSGGGYDERAEELTAETLTVLCFGLVAAALTPLIVRVFFAVHDTIRPFVVTIITVVLNTTLAILLAASFGVVGIGLASSVSNTVGLIALLAFLRWKYLKTGALFSSAKALYVLIAALTMTFLLQGIMKVVTFSPYWLYLLGQILLLTALGTLIYLAVIFLFFRKGMVPFLKALWH